jgi:hypothetical protein
LVQGFEVSLFSELLGLLGSHVIIESWDWWICSSVGSEVDGINEICNSGLVLVFGKCLLCLRKLNLAIVELLVGGSHSSLSTNNFGHGCNWWVAIWDITRFDSWCSPQIVISSPKLVIESRFKLKYGLFCQSALLILKMLLGISDDSFLGADCCVNF